MLAANHEQTDVRPGEHMGTLKGLPTPAQVEDGEPEALLGDPMTEDASRDMPALMCGAEDKGLDTGECELLPGHRGPHQNAGGVWPNK